MSFKFLIYFCHYNIITCCLCISMPFTTDYYQSLPFTTIYFRLLPFTSTFYILSFLFRLNFCIKKPQVNTDGYFIILDTIDIINDKIEQIPITALYVSTLSFCSFFTLYNNNPIGISITKHTNK